MFPIRELLVYTEEGFGDIRLSIHMINLQPNYTVITALSATGDDMVGVRVLLPTTSPDETGFGHGLLLESVGQESDRLLTLLSNLYDTPLISPARFATRITAAFVDLDDFAMANFGQCDRQPHLRKLKIFLEGEEGEMAEFYLNIHLEEGWMELHEKDEGYRESMLELLQEKGNKNTNS